MASGPKSENSVLFILNHVLPNSVTKMSEKFYRVSNNMFSMSAMSCKYEFQFSK